MGEAHGDTEVAPWTIVLVAVAPTIAVFKDAFAFRMERKGSTENYV